VYAPKSLDVVPALPVTPVGKVDKKVLRARYWAGRTRQVN
jgi:fatty-acyl-CoA synthase